MEKFLGIAMKIFNIITDLLKRGILKSAVLILTIFLSNESIAQSNLYNQPIYQDWSRLFVEGKHQKLLNSVEQNILSNDSHPMAKDIWLKVHEALDDIDQAFDNAPDPLKSQLARLIDIYKTDPLDLPYKYPLNEVKKIKEWSELFRLGIVADSELDAEYELLIDDIIYKNYPNAFTSYWGFSYSLTNYEDLFKKHISRLEEYNNSSLKHYLHNVVKVRPYSKYDAIMAADTFLLENPFEATGLRYKANLCFDLEQYEKAIDSYTKSFHIDPIGRNGFKSLMGIAKSYAIFQEKDTVEQISEKLSSLYRPNDKEVYKYVYCAMVARETGDHGQARKVLEKGIALFPEHHAINYQFGILEKVDKRYEEAIPYLKKAVQSDPGDLDAQKELIEAYRRSGNLDVALEIVNSLQIVDKPLTASLYAEISYLYEEYEEYEAAEEVNLKALDFYPYSTDNYIQLANVQEKQGKYDASNNTLSKLISYQKPTSWVVDKYYTLNSKEVAEKEALNKLYELTEKYPYEEVIWEKIADLSEGSEDKEEVWKKAIKVNPGLLFPYEKIRLLYWDQERWDDIENLFQNAEDAISTHGRYQDKLELNFEKAIYLNGKLRKGQISMDEWYQAKSQFEKYFQMGGYAGAYYNYVGELFLARGLIDSAAWYYIKQFKYRPDISPFDVVSKFGKNKEGIKLMYDYCQRRPYSDRIWNLIHLHNQWGGSSIAAIKFAKDFKEKQGGEYDVSMSYSNLGAHAEWCNDYMNYSSIGKSFFYIGRYNIARKNAWKGSSKVEIDYEKGIATVLLPNGTIVKRKDNLEYGVIESIQVGPVYVSADYDDKGRLTQLNNSAGKEIKVYYNDLGGKNKIVERYNDEKNILTIEYDSVNREKHIVLNNSDSLNIFYNSEGEIDLEYINTRVISTYQSINSTTKALESIESLNDLQLPDLGVPDSVYEKLESELINIRYDIKYSDSTSKEHLDEYISKTIDYTDYMYVHISADNDYAETILATIYDVLLTYSNREIQNWQSNDILKLIQIYHKTIDHIRKFGVDIESWERWISLVEWLEQEKQKQNQLNEYRLKIEELQKYIEEHPIILLSDANWLPNSFLKNDGFWKKYLLNEIVSHNLSEKVELQSVYQRIDGEVIVGTDKGIASLKKGYWQWMGFDDFSRQFDRELPLSKVKGSSNISSFTETTDSTLYIGTLNGLLVGSKLQGGKWSKVNTSQGLSSNVITSLLPLGKSILVGTSNGLSLYEQGTVRGFSELDELEIQDLKGGVYSSYDANYYIVGIKTNQGIFFCFSDNFDNISFQKLEETLFSHVFITDEAEAYILKEKDLYKLAFLDSSNTLIKQYGTIPLDVSDQIYGLVEIPVYSGEKALAAMTDRGLAFYHKKHFEQFDLPFADQKEPVKKSSSTAHNKFQLISSDGVYLFQNENYEESKGKIYDLLTIEEVGMTFIANGESLQYIDHESGERTSIDEFSFYANTTQLAVDSQNRLVFNDGNQILRHTFDPVTNEVIKREELFYCNEYVPEDDEFGKRSLSDILCASDGTIWVTKGRAVFRYRDDGAGVQEYNFFRSETLFPSRTYHIDYVFETLDNRILVIGSRQSHHNYKGINMEGGLLEWDTSEEKFVRLETPEEFNWFLTSYTPIDKDKAVFGTVSGFGEDSKGTMRSYKFYGEAGKNLSYDKVYEENKNLYLGTKGTKLGDGLWLFGCSAGVLAYQDGMWFYPDRFNQMLPDDLELSKYGSRHVNAIETDSKGRVYVGTDRGLMVYDPQGAHPMSFLIHNITPSSAFLHQNMNILQQERDAILASIPEDSEEGEFIKEIEQSQASIDKIDRQIGKGNQNLLRGGPSSDLEKRNVDSLTIVKENLIKVHSDKLYSLQQKEPHIHQLLTLPPLDLVASRKRMKDDEAVIQYIPAERSLFIQVLAKDKVFMKEVSIPRKTLMDTCIAINQQLSKSIQYSDPEKDDKLRESLALLYDLLLRPIQNELDDYSSIYVVPSKAMYYIPFSALVRNKSKNDYSYAVEDFNIGYVSSMYLFNLIYNAQPSTSEEVLLMGNPDGSLKFAEEEVNKINELKSMKSTPFLRFKANTENFKEKATKSKIIHLATHGLLDTTSIKESWIQFFDKKMSMSDIFALNLDNTEMVTLSACETAKGGESGMEYVTLARAFAHAGTPTVIATLWKVEDESTMELMFKFYQYYEISKNKFIALAEAQREMIKSDDFSMNQIARWSAFIPIGKN
ncbi:MAG: CHAT domain-containing protein [Cyclobacteriaceae bacterium]